jgi:hypothetical protein
MEGQQRERRRDPDLTHAGMVNQEGRERQKGQERREGQEGQEGQERR